MRIVKLLLTIFCIPFLATSCQSSRVVNGLFATTLEIELDRDALHLNFSVVNVSEKPQQLKFANNMYRIVITSGEEEMIGFSGSTTVTDSPIYVELAPNEDLCFSESWDFRDRAGDRVSPGEYAVTVTISGELAEKWNALNRDELTSTRRFLLTRKHQEIEGLVLISDLDDSIVLDLKYATCDNFLGRPVYPVAVAAIRRETGERLVRANKIFQEMGYTIKVWDAYRPLSVQRIFWEALPDIKWVGRPPEGPVSRLRPRHNNGMSVDITLVDDDGRELEMPTGFDSFTEQAEASYPHMSEEARCNVNLLKEVMERVGFRNYIREWWHYDDIAEQPTPYLDIPLERFVEFELVVLD